MRLFSKRSNHFCIECFTWILRTLPILVSPVTIIFRKLKIQWPPYYRPEEMELRYPVSTLAKARSDPGAARAQFLHRSPKVSRSEQKNNSRARFSAQFKKTPGSFASSEPGERLRIPPRFASNRPALKLPSGSSASSGVAIAQMPRVRPLGRKGAFPPFIRSAKPSAGQHPFLSTTRVPPPHLARVSGFKRAPSLPS